MKNAHQKYQHRTLEMLIDEVPQNIGVYLKRFRGEQIKITHTQINELRTLVTIVNETNEEVFEFCIVKRDGVFSN